MENKNSPPFTRPSTIPWNRNFEPGRHFNLLWSRSESSTLLFLAIMNNAAMSIYTQAFVWIYVFISFEYTPRSGISGLCGTFMFNFLRDCWALSKAAVPLYIPASSVWGASLLHILTSTPHCLFYYSRFIKCEVVSLVVFICIPLDIFSCAYCSFMYLLWRNICSNPLLIF